MHEFASDPPRKTMGIVQRREPLMEVDTPTSGPEVGLSVLQKVHPKTDLL